jgi:hypothetical protein
MLCKWPWDSFHSFLIVSGVVTEGDRANLTFPSLLKVWGASKPGIFQGNCSEWS